MRFRTLKTVTIDDPTRFKSSKLFGAYFGLTPRRFQSGKVDNTCRISPALEIEARAKVGRSTTQDHTHACSGADAMRQPDCEEKRDPDLAKTAKGDIGSATKLAPKRLIRRWLYARLLALLHDAA